MDAMPVLDDDRGIAHDYFLATNEASENLAKELHACITIQKSFRGFVVRKYLRLLGEAATEIQRLFRGFKGRKIYHLRIEERDFKLQLMRYDCCAVLIQKRWKGYFSRRYVSDYYSRKAYLKKVQDEAKQFRVEQDEEMTRRKLEAKEKYETERLEEFEDATTNLHHLLSTSNRPGVFKSPFGNEFSATAYGICVEDHLRNAMKGTLKKRLPRKLRSTEADIRKSYVHESGHYGVFE